MEMVNLALTSQILLGTKLPAVHKNQIKFAGIVPACIFKALRAISQANVQVATAQTSYAKHFLWKHVMLLVV